jgi:hypothetical protein
MKYRTENTPNGGIAQEKACGRSGKERKRPALFCFKAAIAVY